MDFPALIKSLSDFGGLGIVIAFLIYQTTRADRIREKMQAEHQAEIRLMEEKRLDYDERRLQTDREQVATIAALTAVIQSIGKK